MNLRWLAVIVLLLAATAWGATFVVIKDVLAHISPERFMFWRFLVGGVLLVAFVAFRREFALEDLAPGSILGVFVFAGYWLQTRGLLEITPSRSAFLTGLAVVMVPILDRLIYKSPIQSSGLSSAILAAAGTFFLVGGTSGRVTTGDVLTILCALAFAIHIVLAARLSRRSSPIGLAAIQVSVVALASLPIVVYVGPAPMPRVVIVTILLTGAITTALTFYALMWSQSHLTATEAAVLLAFEPVAAALTSLLAGRDHLTPHLVLGGALILGAMLLSQLGRSATV